jgi:serine/threonine protein kinase
VLLVAVCAMIALYFWSRRQSNDTLSFPLALQSMGMPHSLLAASCFFISHVRGPQGNIDVAEMEIREKIGRGNFADVYRGVWRHTEVAVKKLVRKESEAHVYDEFMKEASVMLYVSFSIHLFSYLCY